MFRRPRADDDLDALAKEFMDASAKPTYRASPRVVLTERQPGDAPTIDDAPMPPPASGKQSLFAQRHQRQQTQQQQQQQQQQQPAQRAKIDASHAAQQQPAPHDSQSHSHGAPSPPTQPQNQQQSTRTATKKKKKPSLFAQQRQAARDAHSSTAEPQSASPPTPPPSSSQEQPQAPQVAVVGKVLERNTDSFTSTSSSSSDPPLVSSCASVVAPHVMTRLTRGFPTIARLTDAELAESLSRRRSPAKKQPSLFAQQQFTLHQVNPDTPLPQEEFHGAVDSALVGQHSHHAQDVSNSVVGASTVVNESEKTEIHRENLGKVASMSDAERDQMRNEILEVVPPGLQEALARRRSKAKQQQEKSVESKGKGKSVTFSSEPDEERLYEKEEKDSSSSMSVTNSPSEIVEKMREDATRQGWLNMNDMETGKLAWTHEATVASAGDAVTPSEDTHPALAQVAQLRFDFHGYILTGTAREESEPVHTGLHHHGREPDRPGYTVHELILLSRSRNGAQKSIALSTLAAIAERAREDSRDDVLLLVSLTGAAFSARLALDERSLTVIAAGARLLACLARAEDSSVEKASTDTNALVFAQSLAAAKAAAAFNEDEDDPATLCSVTLLDGLLQMRTAERMRFLLEVRREELPPETTDDLVDVLASLCVHSVDGAAKVIGCDRLLLVCAVHLTRPGRVRWRVLRLLRLMCAAGGQGVARELVSDYGIAERILPLLLECVSLVDPHESPQATECARQEAFRLWAVFCRYGLLAGPVADLYAPVFCEGALSPSRTQYSDASRVAALHCIEQIAFAAAHPLEQFPPEGLLWSHVDGLLPSIVQLWTTRGVSSAVLHACALACAAIVEHTPAGLTHPLSVFTRIFDTLLLLTKDEPVWPWSYVRLSRVCLEHMRDAHHECVVAFRLHLTTVFTVGTAQADADVACLSEFVRVGTLLDDTNEKNIAAQVWSTSVNILACARAGDEHIVEWLLHHVILDDRFLLSRPSSFNETIESSAWDVTERAVPLSQGDTKSVSSLRESLSDYFLGGLVGDRAQQHRSKTVWPLRQFAGVRATSLLPCSAYWALIPLELAYDYVNTQGVSMERPLAADNTLAVVTAALQFLYECCTRHGLAASAEPGLCIATLSKVFLLSSSLFTEPKVHALLASLLVLFASTPSATAFFPAGPYEDVYRALLDHFNSVANGNTLFTAYLFYPLRQCCPPLLRARLYREDEDSLLTYLHARGATTLCWSLREHSDPPERDLVLLTSLVALLARRGLPLLLERAPLLFSMALYHVARALFDEDSVVREPLLKLVRQQWKKDLVDHLVWCDWTVPLAVPLARRSEPVLGCF